MDYEARCDQLMAEYGSVDRGITFVLLEDPEGYEGPWISVQAIALSDEPDDDGWVDTYSVEWEADDDGYIDWDSPSCVVPSIFRYNYITGELD